MDTIVVKFVTENYLTLSLVFMLLKGIAKITPWAWDDSVTSLLFGVFEGIRKNNTNTTTKP
jgi:hypothetical protein